MGFKLDDLSPAQRRVIEDRERIFAQMDRELFAEGTRARSGFPVRPAPAEASWGRAATRRRAQAAARAAKRST